MDKDVNAIADPEIVAISTVYQTLKDLEPEAQGRVLNYVAAKLGVVTLSKSAVALREKLSEKPADQQQPSAKEEPEEEEEIPGISPVAKRWMARNGLQASSLSNVFSLGLNEIDLVSKTVPGESTKDRMHNVFLLKGIAAYLGSGAARFTHEQVKEACLHYDAFNAGNFANYFRSLASDVAGTKENGYTLTARGMTNATELLRSMTSGGV
jgi:hypothetical protein